MIRRHDSEDGGLRLREQSALTSLTGGFPARSFDRSMTCRSQGIFGPLLQIQLAIYFRSFIIL
jgi:hypothetical protein